MGKGTPFESPKGGGGGIPGKLPRVEGIGGGPKKDLSVLLLNYTNQKH